MNQSQLKMETDIKQRVNEKSHNDDSSSSNDSNHLINCEKIFIYESDLQCIIDSGVEIGGGDGAICG